MKKNYLIIAAVVIGVAIALWWLNKKNVDVLRQQVINWANSDHNPESRAKRLAGIEQMTDSEIKTLAEIINKYINTNTALPVNLQQFWTYLNNKYSIGG